MINWEDYQIYILCDWEQHVLTFNSVYPLPSRNLVYKSMVWGIYFETKRMSNMDRGKNEMRLLSHELASVERYRQLKLITLFFTFHNQGRLKV